MSQNGHSDRYGQLVEQITDLVLAKLGADDSCPTFCHADVQRIVDASTGTEEQGEIARKGSNIACARPRKQSRCGVGSRGRGAFACRVLSAFICVHLRPIQRKPSTVLDPSRSGILSAATWQSSQKRRTEADPVFPRIPQFRLKAKRKGNAGKTKAKEKLS